MVVTGRHVAVATPAASMTSLAKTLEPSRTAASRDGPKAGMPRADRSSTSPATSGASGPTKTRSTRSDAAASATAAWSSAAPSSTRAWAAMPGLPGAQSTSGSCGERRSARTRACSRPPPPMTRTFIPHPLRGASQGGDELVDRDGRQRLVADRPARAELERDTGHRLLVGRFDDVDEVDAPEGRPLRLDRGAELLDLLVDLPDALRVVLDRLNARGSQRRQHDVGRHAGVLSAPGTSRAPRCQALRSGGRHLLGHGQHEVGLAGADPHGVALAEVALEDRERQRVDQA